MPNLCEVVDCGYPKEHEVYSDRYARIVGVCGAHRIAFQLDYMPDPEVADAKPAAKRGAKAAAAVVSEAPDVATIDETE